MLWSYIPYFKTLVPHLSHLPKIFVDNAENGILQLMYKERMFLGTGGDEFMKKQFLKKQDELLDLLRRQDEYLLKLLKQGHRKLIIKIIKAYLQQHES